ncbi:MAG: HD domain-containing protein [Caldilineaceae bacterium]|nr:HD domain-containing protein [Caldilineaceae bacterium]
MWSPDLYLAAWHYAAAMHGSQKVPGTELPYLTHIGAVAMEVMTALAQSSRVADPNLAVQCALLHDVIEDTPASYGDVAERFGVAVADGVLALTKDTTLPSKSAQMADSLARIRQQPREVWMVKLADRITNLQPPPHDWDPAKIAAYGAEAQVILSSLGEADGWLAARLGGKIGGYGR